MDNIAVVVINGSTREFDKKYHYSIPDGLSEKVVPGIRVLVPFGGGNSLKEAYVLSITGISDFSNLKDIRKIIDAVPVLSQKMITLAEWMKDRYICTYSDAIKCMLPAGIGIKSFKIVNLLECVRQQNDDRQRIIDILRDNEIGRASCRERV